MDGSSTQLEAVVRNQPLLFEMLRSFTMLAAKLNLSHAVRELGSTRQTVRRHIAQLEEIKGGALFEITDRQYQLTELGQTVLPEAEDLLARAQAWVAGNLSQVDGLQHLARSQDDGWFYYQQQHPISRVYSSSSPLLNDVLVAWAKSHGQLEDEAMAAVRPYLTVFRKVEGHWLFTEVGDESAFVSWFGWKYSRSAIGRVMQQLPKGVSLERLMYTAYHEVEINDSVRLDHVFTVMPCGDDAVPTPISYERLLLGGRFPDGSFAMLSAVRRTYDVEIVGVSHEMLRRMPEGFLMTI